MVVHLHTGDTDLPSQPYHKNNHNHHDSALKPPLDSISTEVRPDNNDEDDFLAELNHHMSHFMLQDNHHDYSFHSSSGESKQGSSEGSSSEEPSRPATPENREEVIGKFGKMKLEERRYSRNKKNRDYVIQSSESDDGLCSYQSLIREQIQSIEVSRVKQEEQSEVLCEKQKPQAHQKSKGQQQRSQQFEKKGGNGGRRSRPQRPGPQQGGEGMRVVFLDGSGFRGGTGVFLPPAASATTTNANSSQSSKKQGKGCSTVLIPARVVQALQLHFGQMAATSRPKAAAYLPPLHDVVTSNRAVMYSLEKRESREATTKESSIQNDMILPQEWTY